jgi:hypothetical protein
MPTSAHAGVACFNADIWQQQQSFVSKALMARMLMADALWRN